MLYLPEELQRPLHPVSRAQNITTMHPVLRSKTPSHNKGCPEYYTKL